MESGCLRRRFINIFPKALKGFLGEHLHRVWLILHAAKKDYGLARPFKIKTDGMAPDLKVDPKKVAESKWGSKLYLVCEKCGTRVENPSLPKLLKDHLKARNSPGERAVLTSCQGICPENAIIVTVLENAWEDPKTTVFSIPSSHSASEALDQLND